MQQPKLYVHLPEYISTPDSMDVDIYGNLILSCPNFADGSSSGCIVKISKEDRKVTKWFDVPVHPVTKVARNMGIAVVHRRDDIHDIYICDNQGWSGKDEHAFKGRMLKVTMDGDKIAGWVTMADNMEHPNGVRYRDGYIYVTQSFLSKVNDPSGKLVSCVYKFAENDENIGITNTLADKNILCTFLTLNPDDQYGADGIAFDKEGNLYVGNFGDGAIIRVTFNEDGSVKENAVWAQNTKELQTTDGMIFGADGRLYVADFSANSIARISADGKIVERLAQSPDKSGFGGGLEQPGEPIIYDGKIIASCFDLVTGPGKINTAHEMPATLAYLDL